MGLFSFFRTKNNVITQEARNTVLNYMARYATENPDSIRDVSYIFANSLQIVGALSPKQIKKEASKSNIPIELIALNVLQNCAMTYISPCSVTDFIKYHDDDAYNLYKAVNDEKYNKGLISKHQHEENELLATQIKIGRMF